MFYDLPADFMAFKDLYKILTDNFFTLTKVLRMVSR
jgi:hypothetical protein